jgi:hypothetical protein
MLEVLRKRWAAAIAPVQRLAFAAEVVNENSRCLCFAYLVRRNVELVRVFIERWAGTPVPRTVTVGSVPLRPPSEKFA